MATKPKTGEASPSDRLAAAGKARAKPVTPSYKPAAKIAPGTGGALSYSAGTKVSKDYTPNAAKAKADNSALYGGKNTAYKNSAVATNVKLKKS